MIVRLYPRRVLTHTEVTGLLPWYVNRTLTPGERRDVERHLAQCVACRCELVQEQALHQTLLKTKNADPFLEGAWTRLAARITEPAVRASRVKHAPRTWIAATILLGLTLGLSYKLLPPAPAYRTLADSAMPAQPAQLRVVFASKSTAAARRALMASVGGQIVQGPSVHGVYTLVFSTPDAADKALQRLRTDRAVTFAEPVLRDR